MEESSSETVKKDDSKAKLTPLVLETDDYLIDGTGTGHSAAGSLIPTPTVDSEERDGGSVRRWMALAAISAAFTVGAMSNALVPIAVDFLQYRKTLTMELKYGVVFAISPLVSLLFIAPAMWLGQLDRKCGGLSLLLVASLLWIGAALTCACASLVYHIRRFVIILLARGLGGIAAAASNVAVISIVGSASNDAAQCQALMLAALGFYELGGVFSLLLGGLVSMGGVRLGWQILFCTLAAVSGLSALAVSWARHKVRVYTVPAQAYLPAARDVLAVLKNPLVFFLAMNYILVVVAASFATVLGPLWLRQAFAPGPPSWTIALLYIARSIAFLTALMLKCVEQTVTVLQWRVLALSTVVMILPFICLIVFTSHTPHVSIIVLPLALLGVCMAIVEVNTFPILAQVIQDLTDLHVGGVHFLRINAFQAGHFVGPLLSVALLSQVDFEWTFYVLSMILAFFVPFLGIVKAYESRVRKRLEPEVT